MFRSRGERPLAPLGKAQDLVALELGEAFYDGLGQCTHGGSLALQCVADLNGVLLLPLHGAAPAWSTTFDAPTRATVASVRSHPLLAAEAAPTVAPQGMGMAEKVLLELVIPHGAATYTTSRHLAPPLLPWAPLDPAYGH